MDLLVTLDIIQHKNKRQITISFEYNLALKELVKKHPLVKWSNTHKVFYLPFSKNNTNAIYIYLKQLGYKVNYDAITSKIGEKKIEYQKFKNALLEFKNWLIQKRYSINTIKTYSSMLELFFKHTNYKDLNTVNKKDIEYFTNKYIIKNNYSYTFQNQLVNAIKLFYKYHTNLVLDLNSIDRPKKSKKLPEVLSLDEVKLILSLTKNFKHKTLLSLLYSCGLRIGEVLDIQLSSIDFKRHLLHVKAAKGKKDRYVPISLTMIVVLKRYIFSYKPKTFLFNGIKNPKYSAVSARQVLKRIIQKTTIKKHVTLHTLRHSYATHLLENGTDIRFIQELLGHNDPKTTMIYTHVSTQSLQKIKNPFDDFNI